MFIIPSPSISAFTQKFTHWNASLILRCDINIMYSYRTNHYVHTYIYILTLSQSHEIIALLRRQTCSYTINSFDTKRVDRKRKQPCHLKGRAATVRVGFRQLIPFTTFSNPVYATTTLFVDLMMMENCSRGLLLLLLFFCCIEKDKRR